MIVITDRIRRNMLLSCDHGLMIVNRFDCNHEMVGHGQWLMDHGSASSLEASVCLDAIKDQSHPVIFDVGANIGTFTTWIANERPDSTIWAFEPQRLVFQMLCGNLAINNIDNVHAVPCALGQYADCVSTNEPDYLKNCDFGTFSLVDNTIETMSGSTIMVEVKTLDDVVQQNLIPRVHLIKIDAEGMDLAVLLGASQVIERDHPVLFVEHNDNRRSVLATIKQFLDQFSYQYTQYHNNVLCQ